MSPARIARYELQEFLGGGMSKVYRARDTRIGGTVAVKILTPDAAKDPEAKQRFLAEACTARNVAHENVISVYDYGEDEENGPFMVMEFLRGEDLRQAIRNGHTGDVILKLRIALQIARALRHIHSLNIIHRDIKPENVHVSGAGIVKLMDFGIAKADEFTRTRTGYVLGTPHYMAPEQVSGQGLTGQVDVYAFGIVLFELFTGARPFAGDTVESLFYRILHEDLNVDALRTSGAPRSVCDLVVWCTRKDPKERPAGFDPVIEILERTVSDLSVPTRPLPPSKTNPGLRRIPTRDPRWLVAVIVLAVLVVIPLIYWVVHRRHSATQETLVPAQLSASITTTTGEMVLVPAGDFLSGEKRQSVSLPAFYIDKTEVSNAAYAAFCKATRRKLPPNFPLDAPSLPVVNILISDARAFARFAGKRLPKPAEWEKAARGVDGRTYPWGNERDPSRANVCAHDRAQCEREMKSGEFRIQPVDAFPEGRSPYGALQMAGNVWEFVDERAKPSAEALALFPRLQPRPSAHEPWCLIRGESYAEPLAGSMTWESMEVPERWRDRLIGFRCVKDPR